MAREAAIIEVFGVNGSYWLISGEKTNPDNTKHVAGDEGVILRPKLEGAIDAPVKSLWLPGAFGQTFVDFKWERRELIFTVQTFDPVDDSPEGWEVIDANWRFAFDYVKETVIKYTMPDKPNEPRYLRVRLLEEPKAYNSDSFEGKDPHLWSTASVVMTCAAELPFYVGETKVYTWVPDPGDFEIIVDFSTLPNGSTPPGFTRIAKGGNGGMQIVDGKLVWVESGVLGGYEFWLYNLDESTSDYAEVVVTMPDRSEWGLFDGDLQLIMRCDGTDQNYVFCVIKFEQLFSYVQIGYVKNGFPRFFSLPRGVDLQPGDTLSFGATGLTRYRVKLNNETVHVWTNMTGAETGPGFRKVGARFHAGPDFIGGQVIPATVSKFEARDIVTNDELSYAFTVEVDGDVPVWPRWTLTDKARWTLPDYSFGNEEYGRPIEDAEREVDLPYLPEGAGTVADSDPRKRTLVAANRMHLQGLWGGMDLLYPIPHGTHQITAVVKQAEDGFAARLEVPQWFTRPWGEVPL